MRTLLVLEDEPSVLKLLRHMLKQYSLIEATTAEEALLLFIDHDHQVDLLIADLTLPQLSGIQVALLLRSENPDLPVILTSGYPVSAWSDRDCADLGRLGSKSVAILEKPFRYQLVSDAVCELIGAPQAEKGENCMTDERSQISPSSILRSLKEPPSRTDVHPELGLDSATF